MDAAALIARLERLPPALDALVATLPDADWRWRPADGAWSILEVVNHLADEETDDFRARVRSTLEDPSRDWAPIDPEGDVVAPDWTNARSHPESRTLHAGDLLASWAAHDARHLEQIAKRLHGLAARDGAPYGVGYAG